VNGKRLPYFRPWHDTNFRPDEDALRPPTENDSLSHILAWVAANTELIAEQRKKLGACQRETSREYIATRRADVNFRMRVNLRGRIQLRLRGL